MRLLRPPRVSEASRNAWQSRDHPPPIPEVMAPAGRKTAPARVPRVAGLGAGDDVVATAATRIVSPRPRANMGPSTGAPASPPRDLSLPPHRTLRCSLIMIAARETAVRPRPWPSTSQKGARRRRRLATSQVLPPWGVRRRRCSPPAASAEFRTCRLRSPASPRSWQPPTTNSTKLGRNLPPNPHRFARCGRLPRLESGVARPPLNHSHRTIVAA